MPISEDEYEVRPVHEPSSTMSKAELRKTHKPIMEKRRRARINHCLNEIKSLVLEAMKKDPARHSKLEKADILEMAVKHLQNVQRQQLALAMASDPTVLRKFKSGFNECLEEVTKYIGEFESVDNSTQQRVVGHLSKCITGIEQIAQINFPRFGNFPFPFATSSKTTEATLTIGDQNNNSNSRVSHSLQLIPSRLPTGEFALLLPNSSNLPYFPTFPEPETRSSAFVTVIPPKSEIPATNKPETIVRRSPSPRGFRPVIPQKFGEMQVSHVTSTVTESLKSQTELKLIKYPIHPYADKKFSPQKVNEPLSVITNQSERYKQAQLIGDSANYEENAAQQGLKRKRAEFPEGLLTVATPDFALSVSKIAKPYHGSCPSDFRDLDTSGTHQKGEKSAFAPQRNLDNVNPEAGSASGARRDDSDLNSDMWRPW